MIIRASRLPRLKIIRQFSVVGEKSVKRQPVLKKGIGNRFKRLNVFATDENMFQAYERLRFYYRLKIRDYYNLVLAPKMFDSKFSFEDYSKDQVQEMFHMKTQEIILQMTKFEEKFQHDKICIDFVTTPSGSFKVQNNMKEITNFVDFFDSGIFSLEDRAFLEDVKKAEEELKLVTLEFGTRLFGSSFEKFSKTRRRRLIEGLKGNHLLRLHDALDAQKNRNFSHLHEMWAENYHIPEFLI